MCEILIRTVDNTNKDPAKDLWCYKAGDVVAVMPDGTPWGRFESKDVWVKQGNPIEKWPGGFAIINLPGVPVTDYLAMSRDGIKSRREQKIDLAPLVDAKVDPVASADYLAKAELTITKQKLDTAVVVKPVIVSPFDELISI